MPTTNLGLKNDYASGDTIAAAWLNSVADSVDVAARFAHLAKSVAGGTDVTLTTDEGDSTTITLTGTLTASINVILPATGGRSWTVFNNTAGAFTVTLKTAAGTGIVVAQTKTAVLWSDGTNILRATADV